LTIDAGNQSRIFDIVSGANVVISNMALANGWSNGNGGAIFANYADVTINNVVFQDNQAASNGGAVYSNRGSLTVVSRRRPEPQEVSSLGADTVIVRCTARTASGTTSGAEPEQQVELAMGEAAMMGFLAWLEAAPRDPYRRRLSAGAVTARRPASTARRRDRCSPAGRG